MAAAASVTTSLLLARRFSSERSKRWSSRSSRSSSGSSRRTACSNSSCPVSSPSRTTMVSGIEGTIPGGPARDSAEHRIEEGDSLRARGRGMNILRPPGAKRATPVQPQPSPQCAVRSSREHAPESAPDPAHRTRTGGRSRSGRGTSADVAISSSRAFAGPAQEDNPGRTAPVLRAIHPTL